MSYIGNTPISAAFLTDTFSGNGSTVAFTMTVAPANTSSIIVAVTGVLQDPSTYSVSGTTLTFSAAPPSGTSNISVRYLGIPASGVTTTAYRTVTNFTATAGQTSFSVPSYTVGYIDVYRNGVRLVNGGTDFVATTGTTVVLNNACTVGDSVVTESFLVSSVLNAIPATAGAVNSTYITDAAVTQAKLAANVAGNGPAFSAYLLANQAVTTNTFTKVTINTEEFDTASCFNNTGSTVGGIPAYAFQPNVAGYYQVNGANYPATTVVGINIYIYKNGIAIKGGWGTTASTVTSALIYMNGSTDYIESYTYLQGTTPSLLGASQLTFFQAYLVRSA
jgi:hypothetical protein